MVDVQLTGSQNTFQMKPDQSAIAIDCPDKQCVMFFLAKYGTLQPTDHWFMSIW